MSASTTPFLDLKLLAAAQAQKHVTHNEALMALDALVHLTVSSAALAAPPVSPAEGDRAIVAASATGAFAGHDMQVALYRDGGWSFHTPRTGWRAWCTASSQLLVFDGTQWTSATPDPHGSSHFGINTGADTTNRLAVAAPATLLTHDGAGHQMKINKAASTDTASLVLQKAYSGRAEIGLCGDDRLHVKTSANGAGWDEMLVIDSASGWMGIGGYTAPGNTGAAASRDMIVDAGASGMCEMRIASHSDIASAGLSGARSRGSMAAPTAAANGDIMLSLTGRLHDGGSYRNACIIRMQVDGTVQASGAPGKISFQTKGAAVGAVMLPRLEISSDGGTRPGADNAYSFGDASCRWSSIWAATGTIQTSDVRQKKDIADSALGLAFITALRPVSYKWIIGSNEASGTEDESGNVTTILTPKAGKRTHYGLIAQEVKAALALVGVEDFAGYIKTDPTDPDSSEGLRYDQFIAPLIRAVQELSASMEALSTKTEQLAARVAALESA